MRATSALVVLALAALCIPAPASAKGFTRIVLVGSDGRWVEVRGHESEIDRLIGARGAAHIGGGYLRLFFVGPGDFPANPARYYPTQRCVALDWPTYETTCARVSRSVARLFASARSFVEFRRRPTVLGRITYGGRFPAELKTAAALASPVELALDRTGVPASRARNCYALTGRWRGPRAALRPRRFLLCPGGVYAGDRLYPLSRGVWAWFRLNVGPP